MTNFEYLYEKKEYELFSAAAAEAEKVYASSPAMCAVGCRKALELAGRKDLIGFGPKCLIKPRKGEQVSPGMQKKSRKKTIRNVHKKKGR